MPQKSIGKNYAYNLCYQILVMVTPLITTPYISRVLGADGVGKVSYAESILSYFVLFASMGISTYGQREISYVQDSCKKRSVVFWNTKLFSICSSTIALIAYLALAIRQENVPLYLILSLQILSVATDVTWFFQGMEEFGKVVLRNIIITIINVIYLLLVVKTPADLLLYAFGRSFFLLVSNVSLWSRLPGYIYKITPKDLHPFRDTKTILALFVPTIAIQVYTVLDKTMIGMITGNPFENGYYEQAIKISKIVLTVATALSTVMIPRIGYHFQKKEIAEVKRLMFRSYRFIWFLGIPLCFGTMITAPNFIPWFLGPGYEKTVDILGILPFLILAIGLSNVTGLQYLVPTKRQNLLSISVTLGACTNLVLNLFLIPPYGSMGAAIASVMAETVVTVSQLCFVRKELSPKRIFTEGIPYYIAGLIMAMILFALRSVLIPSVVNTLLLVACGASVYFMALFILKDDFFVSLLKNTFRKIFGNLN